MRHGESATAFAVEMKFYIHIVIPLAVCCTTLLAQTESRATQTLTIEVKPIVRLSVSSMNPRPMIVDMPVSGRSLATDRSTRYSVLSNVNHKKIVVSINRSMPFNTRLMINLASGKGVSKGSVDISNALIPVDVVTDIGRGNDRDQTITYSFEAGAMAPPFDLDSRTVLLTLSE
jgi:hypothetical protein